MGWGNCGTDSIGRPIGYNARATCDHPGCSTVIHRGLAYACGGMHGEDEFSCEGYFCGEHLVVERIEGGQRPSVVAVCPECSKRGCEAGLFVVEREVAE